MPETNTEKSKTLVDTIARNNPDEAQGMLNVGLHDMSPEDVPVIVETLKRWPDQRGIVWRASAILAQIAGHDNTSGANAVAIQITNICFAAQYHIDDPVVQANVLNSLRWALQKADDCNKMLLPEDQLFIKSCIVLHLTDRWVQSHGKVVLENLPSIDLPEELSFLEAAIAGAPAEAEPVAPEVAAPQEVAQEATALEPAAQEVKHEAEVAAPQEVAQETTVSEPAAQEVKDEESEIQEGASHEGITSECEQEQTTYQVLESIQNNVAQRAKERRKADKASKVKADQERVLAEAAEAAGEVG